MFVLKQRKNGKGFAAFAAMAGRAKHVCLRVAASSALVVMGFLVGPGLSQAHEYPPCAWPVEASPWGTGNFTAPDTFARYWWMPFNAGQWEKMTIKGTYPNARYFSFVVYDEDPQYAEVPKDIVGHLIDAQVIPDAGSVNPFVPIGDHGRKPFLASDGNYTIEISRHVLANPASENTIIVNTDFVWVLFRLYVPAKGLTGGVPLPKIWLTNGGGVSEELKLCSPVNQRSDLQRFVNTLFPTDLDLIWPEEGNSAPPTDRLWLGAPEVVPPRLFPNPDNKYIMMLPGPYQSDRIIVIHGKAPSIPGTFDGAPVWTPARGFNSVQMRYWSACLTDFILPISVVSCATDFETARRGGYYTMVISNDIARPRWLPPNVTWFPWGDGAAIPDSGDPDQVPKLFFFRNMLPAEDFPYSIQEAKAQPGCTFDFQLPIVPKREEIDASGMCIQDVMGDYYPVAAWCDRSTFVHGGWRACLKNVD
jgi:hypothetical protein